MTNPLSESTVRQIALALCQERAALAKEAAFWDAVAKKPGAGEGTIQFQAAARACLEANAAALRELSQEIAPWIKHLPALPDVFPETQQETAEAKKETP